MIKGFMVESKDKKNQSIKPVYIKPLLKGLATYIPGIYNLRRNGTGGTISARYCYTVWLRHLVMAYKNGFSTQMNAVAEFGPGDSLGTGLAALLSGASKYYACDIIKYADPKKNLEIFDELVELFKKHCDIPDESEFPRVNPRLNSYEFPVHILTDERLHEALKHDRITSIKKALLNMGNSNEKSAQISYVVPWNNSVNIKESIDMLFSQSVLEYIDNLQEIFAVFCRLLKPGGIMSHQIDYTSQGITREWNGHWAIPDFIWKIIKGKRLYLINRQTHSTYINILKKYGFEVVCEIKIKDITGIQRSQLTSRFKDISDDDLVTRGAFIQAVKKRLK